MGITAISGPHLTYGITVSASGAVGEYNEERGPSAFDLGNATLDPRYQQFGYEPASPVGSQVKCLWDNQGIIDYIPFLGSSAIVQSTGTGVAVGGTALTLAPISSVGGKLTTIIAPELGTAVSVVAADSTAATINFGTGGTIAVYNPAAGSGRSVLILGSCSNTTEAFIVRGRDMYGFKMTELIQPSTTSTGTGNGLKAFKYVQSVTASTSGTFTSTGISVGWGDRIGLPLYAPSMTGITIWTASGGIAAGNVTTLTTGTMTVGSTAVTQTATMPDVRGTYNSTTATNGTSANGAGGYFPTSTGLRITIYQPVTPNMAGQISLTSNTSAWFGATQFSDF